MDKILMKGMRFFGHHGVLPQERELGQFFEVDVDISLDLEAAGKKDDLNLTVSYADVFGLVEEVVTGEPCSLIEALAHRVADGVLENYSLVQAVRVTVKKPSAPIRGAFEYMAAEITRNR